MWNHLKISKSIRGSTFNSPESVLSD